MAMPPWTCPASSGGEMMMATEAFLRHLSLFTRMVNKGDAHAGSSYMLSRNMVSSRW